MPCGNRKCIGYNPDKESGCGASSVMQAKQCDEYYEEDTELRQALKELHTNAEGYKFFKLLIERVEKCG